MAGLPFTKAFNQILKEIKDSKKDGSRQIPSEYLGALIFMFGEELTNAFKLIETNCIHLVKSTSNREVFKVKGNDYNIYICFKYTFYCSCPAFKHKVMSCKELMCKHLLATRIADAIEVYEIEYITDQQMIELLRGVRQAAIDDQDVQFE